MASHRPATNGRHLASSGPRRPYRGIFTAIVLLLGGILIGGLLTYIDDDDKPVNVTPVAVEQGLNLAELCSAINADTIDKFRNSGVIIVEVPPEFDDNELIAQLTRRQLKCSGETVSGVEANRRICNNLTPTALRELATKVGVEESETAKIGQENVDQARDVFKCDEIVTDTTPTTGSTSTTTTKATTTTPVPADPSFTPDNEQFGGPDPDSVNK